MSLEALCFLRANSWSYPWFFSYLNSSQHIKQQVLLALFTKHNLYMFTSLWFHYLHIEWKPHISIFQNYKKLPNCFCFHPPPQLFSRPVVLEVRSMDFRETMRFSDSVCLLRQNHFYHDTNILFAFFTVWVFAQMMQKQWEVNSGCLSTNEGNDRRLYC